MREATVAERFESKFTRLGEDECWEWEGSRNDRGYGTFRFGGMPGRTISAHRMSFLISHGFLPSGTKGKIICHSCDNKLCVNPAHLRLQTYGDNRADRRVEPLFKEGERWLMARIYNTGKFSQYFLSRIFKCSQPTICRELIVIEHKEVYDGA